MAPLLQTKLHIPIRRAELVSRPRLIQRLNEGLTGKLTLVSAPAGFGKTTLLSEWVSRMGAGKVQSAIPNRVAWLSLDEGDNDLVRFLSYLIAAFQRIEEGFGAGALGALQQPRPPSMQELLTALINQISAIAGDYTAFQQSHSEPGGKTLDNGGGRRDFILVIDDYHLITARPIHEALTFLLDHLPENLHLVIATRSDPPLHLARLRGRGQLAELRQADMRFTPGEVAEFLKQVVRLELSADDVTALAWRTEGWAAGLQMAAVSMQGQRPGHVASFIQAFTGSNRFILDYLVEEVIDQRPRGTRDFLLRTAILDRLSGPLCDAVCAEASNGTGQVSGQRTLEQLEQANLFIAPLDDERRWYRYHHLFADLLRQRLHQEQPDLVPALHRRASEWYERNRLMDEAVKHALAAGDFERAMDLIEQAAEAIWKRAEVATFLRWLDALPEEMVRSRPLLCVYHALALLMGSRPLEEVESRLQIAAEADVAGSVSGELALVRALIAIYQGDVQQGSDLSRRALTRLPEHSLFLRSLVAGMLGLARLYSGDVKSAIRALEEAASISQQAGNLFNSVLALCHLAELCYLQGQLYAARAYYEQALGLATNGDGRRQPIACVALIGLGELLREWNDLEAAVHHVMEGIQLGKGIGQIHVLTGYVVLAYIKQAQGDVKGAREAIQTAQQIAVKFDAMQMDDVKVAMHQARLGLAQGNVAAAVRWLEERGPDVNVYSSESVAESRAVSPPILHEFEHITATRVYIARSQFDRALAALEPLRESTEAAGWTRFLIEVLILESLALQAQGDVGRALASLERALSLAEPEGFVRLFIDEGEPMAQLLYEASARGAAPGYVHKLLGALDVSMYREPESAPPARYTQPLIEPLSERELDVLQLIAEGASNQEVAQRLYLSLHTVKWHTGNIYGKLGVRNRTQAVAKARALGVLALP